MSMSKEEARSRRKRRIRKKIKGSDVRPRLAIFRSNKYIYAQIINDLTGETLASSSTLVLAKAGETVKLDKAGAARVGKDIAEKAKAKNIEAVVFDRCGYLYHGRVKALADGAREAGLKF